MSRRAVFVSALALLSATARAQQLQPQLQQQIDRDPDLVPVADTTGTISDVDDFVARVLAGNSDTVVAVQEVERVRGVARQSLAALLPNVSASGTAQYTYPETLILTGASGASGASAMGGFGVTAKPVTASASLSLSQSLIAVQTWNNVGTKKRAIANALATAQDRARTTLVTAADDLVAVVSAARAAEVSRVGLRSSLETATLTGRKVELGSATKLDLIRTQQDVESARETVISANETLRKAREALGLVMGTTEPMGIAPAVQADTLEAALARRCPARLVAERPDVVAAQIDAEMSRRDVLSARLAYVPSLALSSSLQTSTIAQFGSYWSFNLAATLTIPIWDGGGREGVLRSARATLREKEAQLGGTARAASIQETQTSREVEVAAAAQAVSTRSRQLAEDTARLTREAFATGSGTSFDVVDSARKAREAELDLVGKNYDLVRARVEAHLAAATCTP